MPHKKLSPNAPCPCGSGKKYKDCCRGEGFEWVENEDGTVYKSTPISPDVPRSCNSSGRCLPMANPPAERVS